MSRPRTATLGSTATRDPSAGPASLPRRAASPGGAGRSTVEVHRGVGDRLVRAWDELALATGAAPWLRPGWVLAWSQTMGRAPLQVLVLRAPDGRVRAVLPLQRSRTASTSPTNWHSPGFEVIAEDDHARRLVLLTALRRCGTRLTLDFVTPSLAAELAELAAGVGGRASTRVLERSPLLTLDDDWESRLHADVRRELRRRGRRLAERGEVGFEVHDGSQGLDALLEEGLAVEASGWKGRSGTAVASDPATRAFYTRTARWAAGEGLLRLAFLRLDGRALAFDLALERGGTQYLLKTGYADDERGSGPGMQLRWRVLADCAARGLTTYAFLGQDQPWKRVWTRQTTDLMQAHAFPPGSAGLVGWTEHGLLLPVARTVRDRLQR